jgi:hypothetical protein
MQITTIGIDLATRKLRCGCRANQELKFDPRKLSRQDAAKPIPVAVWLLAGNICYVNAIVPVPVVMMPWPSPILGPVAAFPHW